MSSAGGGAAVSPVSAGTGIIWRSSGAYRPRHEAPLGSALGLFLGEGGLPDPGAPGVIQGGVEKLQTLHPDLSRLIRQVAETWDVVILETSRTPERQAELVAQGKSKTLQSKHLIQPDGYAHAGDWVPLPVDWNDTPRWYYFGGFTLATAREMGIAVTWGGDWNRNTQVTDQSFNDLDHIERTDT